MVKTALILALCGALTSCVSTEGRVIAAGQAKGEAQARRDLPANLPADCTALVGKVTPGSEAWAVSFRRLEILAENRDDKTQNCVKWWDDYKQRVAKAPGPL